MKRKLLAVFVILIVGAISRCSSEMKPASNQAVLDLGEQVLLASSPSTVKKQITPGPFRGNVEPQQGKLTVSGIIAETNSFRRQHRLPQLQVNEELNSAARAKLDDIFSQNYFAHVSPSGKGVSYWVERAGYDSAMVGENLALGNFSDDAELVEGWMNSPGHRENILNPFFTDIGVAAAKGEVEGSHVWVAVQILAKPMSACPQVDSDLEKEIAQLREELEGLKSEMAELQTHLKEDMPEDGASQEELDAYNERVKEYNQLVNEYNQLLVTLEQEVDEYNDQVQAFNDCAG
jgi:uncharacterized protein YkwD/uncharacterized protein YukE